MNKWEQKALEYAEKHGIIDYEVSHRMMVYHEQWSEGSYIIEYDLDREHEIARKLIG